MSLHHCSILQNNRNIQYTSSTTHNSGFSHSFANNRHRNKEIKESLYVYISSYVLIKNIPATHTHHTRESNSLLSRQLRSRQRKYGNAIMIFKF